MGKNNALLVNILGVALALGIAFGGLLLVQGRLMEEKEDLLRSGGMVEVSGKDLEEEAVKIVETEVPLLTAEELACAVENLKRLEQEAYPHEPLQGQLSMVQAIERSKNWLEDFLMPRLGAEEYIPQGYKISCYLVAPQAENEDGADKPLYSYWMVALGDQNMEIEMILNAVTGQVLGASARCLFSVVNLEDGTWVGLLGDFAESFGLGGEEYTVVASKAPSEQGEGAFMFQSVGNTAIFATLRTGKVVVSPTQFDEYKEILYIRLWLGRDVFAQ